MKIVDTRQTIIKLKDKSGRQILSQAVFDKDFHPIIRYQDRLFSFSYNAEPHSAFQIPLVYVEAEPHTL